MARKLTDKPFGVNLMLMSPFIDEAVEVGSILQSVSSSICITSSIISRESSPISLNVSVVETSDASFPRY